jgi:hypothetical protein
VAGSSHFMEEEQTPPPPPPLEQVQDWGARFSTEIFGYNPYYYGKHSAPIAHPSQITISESIYLNSPLHWILDKSQIGGSSHPGDGSQGQWSAVASSPGPSWILDDKGGEDSRLKPQVCAVWVAVCVAPVWPVPVGCWNKPCNKLELYLSGLENICVSATVCLKPYCNI